MFVWRCYVHDIFCILKRHQVEEALSILNEREESINFTVKIQKDNRLPFLDLLLENSEGKIQFNIYRKPTSTDGYINSLAYNPWSHKTAAFRSLVDRLFNVPLKKDDFETEKHKIYEVATKNGFHRDVIDQLIRKKETGATQKTNLSPETKKEKNFRKFSFHTKFCHEFQRIFQKFKIDSLL